MRGRGEESKQELDSGAMRVKNLIHENNTVVSTVYTVNYCLCLFLDKKLVMKTINVIKDYILIKIISKIRFIRPMKIGQISG